MALYSASRQRGTLYEIPLLLMLALIALVVGTGQHSWFAGLAVLFGVPLALVALFKGMDLIILAKEQSRVRALAAQLADARPERRREAAAGLGAMHMAPELAAAPLAAALADSDGAVRHAAALSLVKLRTRRELAVPVLIGSLADPSLRTEAVRAFGDIGTAAAAAAAPLAALLDDPAIDDRWAVAAALRDVGAAPALPQLLRALGDADASLVEWSVQAVCSLGPLAAAALPQLASLAADGNRPRVRGEAIQALGAVGGAAAMPALRGLAADAEPWVRRAALRELAGIKPLPADAHALINAALNDADEAIRTYAAEVLRRLEGAATGKDGVRT